MLKSYGWGGGVGWGGVVVAHVILVSAQGPNPFFFFFWGTFIQLRGLFGQGLGLRLGPGLDKKIKTWGCQISLQLIWIESKKSYLFLNFKAKREGIKYFYDQCDYESKYVHSLSLKLTNSHNPSFKNACIVDTVWVLKKGRVWKGGGFRRV